MWDFISSSEFPETAEYIEKLIPDTIDGMITFSGSIEFKFRVHTDQRGYTYPIPGMRTNKRLQYLIETKGELPFKSGDIVRFGLADTRRYTITSIDYIVDSRNEEEYVLKSLAWPGMAEDKVKIKLITLE